MKPFALGHVYETQNRIRQEFLDFAEQWNTTREAWRDEPARKFQQESLGRLEPTLNRVSGTLAAFAEAIRHADAAVADPDQHWE